jgi:hypothetical protein
MLLRILSRIVPFLKLQHGLPFREDQVSIETPGRLESRGLDSSSPRNGGINPHAHDDQRLFDRLVPSIR